MPLTISYVIVGLIAVTANAHYVWKDDHDSTNHHSMFPRMNFPTFPGIPQFNFPSLPAFPMMPSMEFPQPHKGFNGVSVSASSFQGVDKDGKHYRKGGTSILTSEDGVEKEITLENGTPNVVV
ncbi:seroin-like [Pararge aegeria]|uniref:Jg7414 protein n=1 Tax=Pararge aegeria aegeria TaxID=348720 RepID=A0A8S4RRE3_9NEOP|nr:seroin-like [Pararge aegeria]CAH2240071.1 jg7414 [Pararge aegeria aegeria]